LVTLELPSAQRVHVACARGANEFLMSKQKGVSMETVETGLDLPLVYGLYEMGHIHVAAKHIVSVTF